MILHLLMLKLGTIECFSKKIKVIKKNDVSVLGV